MRFVLCWGWKSGWKGAVELLKVMAIFGTRPEAIKMCPVILELQRHPDVKCVVCLTGQHEEMLSQVTDIFKIKPDYNLKIMRQQQSLGMITSAALQGIDDVLEKEKPDIALVHGDTSTSFAAALAAFYHQIPVGHVEAGLRTYHLKSPYPEEFNRQTIDIIADYYFAPTDTAADNLRREGKDINKIYVTGNTVIDALRTTVTNDYVNEHLEWAKGSRLILMTAHRRENIGKPMEEMFRGIRKIVEDNADVKVLYPIHKNPAVRRTADTYLSGHRRIRVIEPLDVFDFHNFMSRSFLILTDSGGIQEEAPSLGKPVLVMRDTTERPEGIKAGTLKLVGTSGESIYEETCRLLKDRESYERMSRAVNPYGDGHASERIVRILRQKFCGGVARS